ncbi:MAG: thermonuclease family protein [Chitinophagales bacterium]
MAVPKIKTYFKISSFRPSRKKFISAPDGDTLNIQQPLRMVSCDTPEKEGYAGKAPAAQKLLDICKERLAGEFYTGIPEATRKYLLKKLTPQAAKKHIKAGNEASKQFEIIRNSIIKKGPRRYYPVAVIPCGEVIDSYGRMLAYIARFFDKANLPPKNDPKRKTFNLLMIEEGWAVFFPIYPSLPKDKEDFELMIAAAETAWKKKKGMFGKYGEDILLPYEFRMCVKMAEAETAKDGIRSAFQRNCIDVRTMTLLDKFSYHTIAPCYRLWVWNDDVKQATIDLGLK